MQGFYGRLSLCMRGSARSMKCQKVISLLTQYYDDALNKKTSSKVKEHLSQCEDCRIKFEEFEKGLIILKRLKPIE